MDAANFCVHFCIQSGLSFFSFCNSPFYIFPFLQTKIGVKKKALNNIVVEMVELGDSYACHFQHKASPLH